MLRAKSSEGPAACGWQQRRQAPWQASPSTLPPPCSSRFGVFQREKSSPRLPALPGQYVWQHSRAGIATSPRSSPLVHVQRRLRDLIPLYLHQVALNLPGACCSSQPYFPSLSAFLELACSVSQLQFPATPSPLHPFSSLHLSCFPQEKRMSHPDMKIYTSIGLNKYQDVFGSVYILLTHIPSPPAPLTWYPRQPAFLCQGWNHPFFPYIKKN